MRIAIITHNIIRQGSGQGRVSYELAKYLLMKGYTVDIYAEHIDEKLIREDKVNFFIIRTIQKPAIIRAVMLITIVSVKLIFIRLRKPKYYDIIHIDSGCSAINLWNVSTCHYCHTSCIKYEEGIYHKLFTLLNSWIEKSMYKNKNGHIIAVSKKMKFDLQKHLDVNSKNIDVVYNGVDLKEFNPVGRDIARQMLLKTYNWDNNDFILLFVGDLIRRKGVDLLLDVMKQLQPEIKLVIVGHKRKIYTKKVKSYGLENRVKLLGFQTNIGNTYKGADALVLPSLYDSFGNVVLEAMACGTPAIVSVFAGSSEIISNGENGITFRHPKELIEKINLLNSNRDLWNSISTNARNYAAIYSWTNMAASVEKLYLEFTKKS